MDFGIKLIFKNCLSEKTGSSSERHKESHETGVIYNIPRGADLDHEHFKKRMELMVGRKGYHMKQVSTN
jgi:hypothetical protein